MISPQPKSLTIEQQGDTSIVQLHSSQLTDHTVREVLEEPLEQWLSQQPCTRLVCDFSSVEYLSSAALQSLLRLHSIMKSRQGSLALCRLHPQIQEIMNVSRLSELFDIQPDVQQAVQRA